MKHGIGICVFTIVVTLFYYYVGQLVPQKRVDPPATAEVTADMTVEQMVAAGKTLVEGEGTCLNCHNGSERFPDFYQPVPMGVRAKDRRDGYSDVDYLVESLCAPDVFIVEPYAPGMPPAQKPPIGLNHQQIIAIVAYMQSIGSEVTVSMDYDISKYCGEEAAIVAAADTGTDTGTVPRKDLSGKELLVEYGCLACHSLDGPVRMLGPSLYDVGSRLSKANLYLEIVEPDVVIAEGYPPGIMSATLTGGGFHDKITSAELQRMVDFLFSLKGEESNSPENKANE